MRMRTDMRTAWRRRSLQPAVPRHARCLLCRCREGQLTGSTLACSPVATRAASSCARPGNCDKNRVILWRLHCRVRWWTATSGA